MKCYRDGGCGPYEMYSCADCPASKPEYAARDKKVLTNADHIRSMTDEELAEWFDRGFCGSRSLAECRGFNGGCAVCVLDWLKKPYKEDME